MKRIVILTLCAASVAGCGQQVQTAVGEGRANGISSDITLRPKARPDGISPSSLAARPPSGARTQDAFDTTTSEERAAALDVPTSTGERELGVTVASLGSPTEPGFWLKTPLVSAQTEGRVVLAATGKSVQVTLIPIDGPPTAGSRMSLPALRLLEAPLTALSEVTVYADS